MVWIQPSEALVNLLDGTELYPIPLFSESPVHQPFFHNYTLNLDSSTPTSRIVQLEVHFTSTPSSTPSSTYTSTPSSPIKLLYTLVLVLILLFYCFNIPIYTLYYNITITTVIFKNCISGMSLLFCPYNTTIKPSSTPILISLLSYIHRPLL